MWKNGSTLSHPIPQNKLRLKEKHHYKRLEGETRAYGTVSGGQKSKVFLKGTIENFSYIIFEDVLTVKQH